MLIEFFQRFFIVRFNRPLPPYLFRYVLVFGQGIPNFWIGNLRIFIQGYLTISLFYRIRKVLLLVWLLKSRERVEKSVCRGSVLEKFLLNNDLFWRTSLVWEVIRKITEAKAKMSVTCALVFRNKVCWCGLGWFWIVKAIWVVQKSNISSLT